MIACSRSHLGALSYILTLTMLVVLLLLAVLSKNVLAETTISAARVWSGTEYTRFTLESTSKIQYSLIMLDNPGRVVVDIEDATPTPALKRLAKKIKANDALIKTMRIGQFTPHTLRLVFDLKAAVVPQAFTLEPINNFDHRLVLDIYPADKAANIDSIEKLLASLLELESEPDNSKYLSNLELESEPEPESSKYLSNLELESEPENSKYLSNNVKQQQVLLVARTIKPMAPIIPLTPRVIIVAIDAGHGGEDPGAIGYNGTHEKDITLAIAKKLKIKIDQEPNMRGVLIRDGDHSMSLSIRRAKARRLKADLFVSVHADAAKRRGAHGSSVYTLSQHGATSTAADWLAKKENSADRKLTNGIDISAISTDIKEVLIDLSLSATTNDSVKLAQHVLDELGSINHLHKDEVEQAGFAVLKSPDIPSILVETAFLSNPGDERKLITKIYQNKMANAMFLGIKRYFAAGPALSRTSIAQSE